MRREHKKGEYSKKTEPNKPPHRISGLGSQGHLAVKENRDRDTYQTPRPTLTCTGMGIQTFQGWCRQLSPASKQEYVDPFLPILLIPTEAPAPT